MYYTSIFKSTPRQLAGIFEEIYLLQPLAEKIKKKNVTGFDLFSMTGEAFLTLLGNSIDQDVLTELYKLKTDLYPSQQEIKKGCVISYENEQITICCPTMSPTIFQIHYLETNVIKVGNATLEQGSPCELLFDHNDLVSIIVHELLQTYNYSYVLYEPKQQSEDSEFALDESPIYNDIPSQAPETQSIFVQENVFFSQQISTQQPKLQFSQVASYPQMTKSFGYCTNSKFLGRLDFLIDFIGFIIVPKQQLHFNQYSFTKEQIYECREFNFKELGLVVAVNTYLMQTYIQIQRGDIVEFELVPGYYYQYIGVNHLYYPLCCEKLTKKMYNLVEFEEYFKAYTTYEMTPFADNLYIVSRIEKYYIKEHLVHGQTYLGIVYTFYDNDSYGFIKSCGTLYNAKSYSYGFEVYFKIYYNYRLNYTPQKGDLVSFRSHWVDEKAQARDIKFIYYNQMPLKGYCVGLCPPFAVIYAKETFYNIEFVYNLFFVRLRQISFPLYLGYLVGFSFDPDISSHFRAQNLQYEMGTKISFSQQPSYKTILAMPWDQFLYFNKVNVLFKHIQVYNTVYKTGKAIVFQNTEKPNTISAVGLELVLKDVMKPLKEDKQSYLAYYQPYQTSAVLIGEKYDVQVTGISEEYVFFTQNAGIGLCISRQHCYYATAFKQKVIIKPDFYTEHQVVTCDDKTFIVLYWAQIE